MKLKQFFLISYNFIFYSIEIIMSGFLAAVKTYGPVSLWPMLVITCIYYDWSKTQAYKKRKEFEKLGLRSGIDKKINL